MAQTSFGAATSIVLPVVAATSTFTGQVTLYNPNGSDITVALDFFEANTVLPPATPGAKTCSDVVIPANSSVQFGLATQCTLGSGSHYGLLVASDSAGTNLFYGYSRTQNNAAAGFSIEGFPSGNFSTVTSYATGLTSGFTSPTYQTNCFVDSLADAVTYDLKLFDGTTGTQIGSTISGSLGAFEQIRYLDVFSVAAAPAGDYANVRAEFTRTSAGTQVLIGFCTVQDNTSFGADFRIAKSPPPATVPITTIPWGGAVGTIPSLAVAYVFAGPTATVPLLAPGHVSAYGSAGLARQSGPVANVTIAVCYQNQSGPGPVTPMGTPAVVGVGTTVISYGQSGSAALAAGTYNVGFCVLNNDPGSPSLNKNDTTSGFVVVTP